MFRTFITTIIAVVTITFSYPSWSYDAAIANGFNSMFAPVKGAAVGKHLHLIPPEKFVAKVNKNQPMMVVDVRTPAETSVLGITLTGSKSIPLAELFKPANLQSLPKNKPVIIVCQSGVVATAAGTALRYSGFKNVFILKGGIKGLVSYMGAKQVNPVKK